MAVFRIEKNKNYTIMSNFHFKDKRLSLKAKGLLSEMLSLPDDWNYSIAGLVAINKEKEDTIKSILKELKDAGYLIVNKIYPSKENGGRYEYEYVIFEIPVKIQEGEKQPLVLQQLEKPTLLNTKEQNTELLNMEKESKPKKEKFDALKVIETNYEIYSDPDLFQAWKDFIEFRKEVKPIKTMKGFNGLLNKLRNLSNGDHQVMINILNQSVSNEWYGLFEIKDKAVKSDNPYEDMMREEGIYDPTGSNYFIE